MALLRLFLILGILAVVPVSAHAHHMGRTIPIVHSGGQAAALAGHIVAAYFEEQMGRDTALSEKAGVQATLEQITGRQAPMAVVPVISREQTPGDIVIVLPGLDTGEGVFNLAMGSEAKKDLQFSLVPQYMEKLSKELSPEAWKKGLERVKAGEGVRKVALDMLREGDLL
jgi:hypothetical protein